MRVFLGGFGVQGMLAIPFLDALEELGINGEMVVNGIGGYHAVVRKVLRREEALRRTFELIERIDHELYMIERRWICEGKRKKGWKMVSVEHCVRLALEESFRSWEDVEDLLEGLDVEVDVGAEYIDLLGNVGVFKGKAVDVAKVSLAMVGVFPPHLGKLSTTHLTQIPVLTAEDGDLVLVNLRDPSLCDFAKADEILSQSAEVRSISFAKSVLSEKSVRKVEVSPITRLDLGFLDEIRETIVGKLEGSI